MKLLTLIKWYRVTSKWKAAKKKYIDGEITLSEFLEENASRTVYNATPFGEDVNGNVRLWVLSAGADKGGYYPVFSTPHACVAHMTAHGRAECFPIVEDKLSDVFDTLNAIEPLREFGVVIDPHLPDHILISRYSIPNRSEEQE